MSKTRTGRKGRARLAVAQSLNARSLASNAADADNDAQLFNRMSGLLRGRDFGGALFSEGEVRGPLSDSVNTDDGAPNIFSGNETAAVGANVTGEVSLVATANHTGLNGGVPFAHHYFQHKGANLGAALALSRANPLTSKSGIIYLPSGPAGDYIPSNHGDAATEVYAVSIRPPLSELTAAGETLSNIRYSLVGVAAGYSFDGQFSQHAVATAAMRISRENAGGGADTSAALMTKAGGNEIRVLGETGQTLLSIQMLSDGDSDPGGSASVIAGGVAGDPGNFIVSSATQIYVLEGSDVNVTGAEDMVDNIVAAVSSWNSTYGTGLVVAKDDTTRLTWSMNRLRGAQGNNAFAGDAENATNYNLTNTKNQGLTVTGYSLKFGLLAPLDNANVSGDRWFRRADDAADLDFIAFSGGSSDIVAFAQDGPDSLNAAVSGGKFIATDLDLTITIPGGGTDTAVAGVALVWSLD